MAEQIQKVQHVPNVPLGIRNEQAKSLRASISKCMAKKRIDDLKNVENSKTFRKEMERCKEEFSEWYRIMIG